MFSETLKQNRENLKEGESFLITVIKDMQNQENRFRRVTVRKIENLKKIVNQSYENVYIELDKSHDLQKLSKVINKKGNSKIKIFINDHNKNYLFELKDKRKFDYNIFKTLKKEPFIRKINF